MLRPRRLAKRRWWIRKYPIKIVLASAASELTTIDAHRRSSHFEHRQLSVTTSSTQNIDIGIDVVNTGSVIVETPMSNDPCDADSSDTEQHIQPGNVNIYHFNNNSY